MDPVAPSRETNEPITVTPTEIVYRRHVRVLEHAVESRDVAETCRTFGISRKTFYEWKNLAAAYGLEALVPKQRRSPRQPWRRESESLHVATRG